MKKIILPALLLFFFTTILRSSSMDYATYCDLKFSCFKTYGNEKLNELIEKAKSESMPWRHPEASQVEMKRAFICVRAYEEIGIQMELIVLNNEQSNQEKCKENINRIKEVLKNYKAAKSCKTESEYVEAHTKMVAAFQELSESKDTDIAEIAYDILHGDDFER